MNAVEKKAKPEISLKSFIAHETLIINILFYLVLVLFLSTAISGLRILEHGDESEKFVAAQMIHNGSKLYKDVFAHHGPLPYILAHFYTVFVSSSNFNYARIIPILLALIASVSLYFSPVLTSKTAKLLTLTTFLGVLTPAWLLFGIHFLYYHSLIGLLCVIVLAQLVIPAFTAGAVTRTGCFCAGLFLTLMCFSSYAVGPACILFTVLSLSSICIHSGRFRAVKMPIVFLFLGALIGSTFVLVWLVAFGDVKGYLIYHFYFNQEIYSSFIGIHNISVLGICANMFFSMLKQLTNFSPTYATIMMKGAVLAMLSLFFHIKTKTNYSIIFFVPIALVFLMAIFMLSPVGINSFRGAPVIIAAITIISISVGLMEKRFDFALKGSLPILICLSVIGIMFFISLRTYSSPHNIKLSNIRGFKNNYLNIKDTPILKTIRAITPKNGTTLSLIFNVTHYITSGILPASGYYYYLPWQAAYKKKSITGYNIDICADIKKYKPTTISFDNWKVWDTYSISEYAPCVVKILENEYVYLDKYIYIRFDQIGSDEIKKYISLFISKNSK